MTANRATWRLSPEGARTLLLWLALSVAVIGAMALGLSFVSVMDAAHPFFGTAAFALPIIIDVAIFALTFTSIAMELNELSSPGARYAARALVALTVFANVAPQHTLYGRIIHGAPPVVWSAVVVIAEHAIRQLVGLASDAETMDKVRRSRWVLAPASTFRLWRRMRLWEITSYRAAIGREHEMRASRALLREWHGPRWRRTAPSAQRLAVALQSSTDRPVAELLAEASEGIMAAARAAAKPAEQDPQTTAETALDDGLRPLDPVLYPAPFRPVLVPFTGHADPFTAGGNTLTDQAGSGGAVNGAVNDGVNGPESDEQTAIRLREQGKSFAQIAEHLGKSKTWAYNVAGAVQPIEHANGSAA